MHRRATKTVVSPVTVSTVGVPVAGAVVPPPPDCGV
jgi:hypothetical protein